MQARLDAYLVRKCPTLFTDHHGDMRNTCMVWGFDCGDGWYQLLKEACLALEPLCRKVYEDGLVKEKPYYPFIRNVMGFVARSPFHFLWSPLYWIVTKITGVYESPIGWCGGPPCRASQIKEKYGTLRFYMTGQTKEMDAIIDKAERRSSVTCEVCGKRGKLRGRVWYYTACKKHVRDSE